MITELGHFALILGFCVAGIQCLVPLVGAMRGWSGWMALARPAAVVQALLITVAFGALIHAFAVSDFSVKLVFENSHSTKPFLYKLAGTWGNHEGSLLLWVLVLSLYGACVALFGSRLPPAVQARVLAVHGALGAAFTGFMLWTSNPFLRLAFAPFEGKGLNPLLQDPGLALHPPFLYLGYVGLSTVYAFAIAALIGGRVDAAWARWVRPWTLVAWVFLTIGIALGSWWAYHELGWGGFWFWDPVENASLMPWLLATALFHSAIVTEKRGALPGWTVLLAILGFGFALIGTFIVRSGVLTSVHSFASDPGRGAVILLLLLVFVGGGLGLYALRAGRLQGGGGVFAPVSREGALLANNILLSVVALVVFVGTLWPLLIEIVTGRKLSVGAPFFDAAVTPFMIGLALILPVGVMLPWKRGRLRRALWGVMPAFILAVCAALVAWTVLTGRSSMAILAVGLGAWGVQGAVLDLWVRAGRRLPRMARLALADWGRAVAHAGFGVVFAVIGVMTATERDDIRALQPGETGDLWGGRVTLVSVVPIVGPNYTANRATLQFERADGTRLILSPERRYYPVERVPTTEAAIRSGLWGDLYITLGERQSDGAWAVRSYDRPLASWLWLGAAMMAAGGGLSLLDRRYRIAAVARKAE